MWLKLFKPYEVSNHFNQFLMLEKGLILNGCYLLLIFDLRSLNMSTKFTCTNSFMKYQSIPIPFRHKVGRYNPQITR